MTLLEEIQKAVIDPTSDLGTVLRKCKLLASRLGSQPLENWVHFELNGYPEKEGVPPFRMWSLELKGHFSGPFGSGIRDAPIPLACIPENIRQQYSQYQCRQSISVIEDILSRAKEGILQVSTGDLAMFLGGKVYQNQHCYQAWAWFGVGNLVEIVNSVRNKVLDFTLELGKKAPDAGEIGGEVTSKLEPSNVTQIFHTIVYGGSVAVVGTNKLTEVNIHPQDFESLSIVLKDNGISEEDLAELDSALESDDEPRPNTGFGPNVASWISKMMKKAAEGSWNISLGTAGNLLAQVIAKFYGLN
jgi:hypothetical protein